MKDVISKRYLGGYTVAIKGYDKKDYEGVESKDINKMYPVIKLSKAKDDKELEKAYLNMIYGGIV